MIQKTSKPKSWGYLALLILAGESVFILPFVLARVFRPTVLEVFDLNNVQLGLCYSVYGLVALGSYLFGGPLADKYPPRKLISVALWMTAAGGILYANYPSFTILRLLYGYWGFTTIFLFWAPMIKATRVWGGSKSQGKAFGFLDGGRGLVGALFGSLGVFIFTIFLGNNNLQSNIVDNREAFSYVILVSSLIVSLVGVATWFFLKYENESTAKHSLEKISITEIKSTIKIPAVWILMIVILCAYVGYKITDVFSLFAKEVMLYDQIASAQVGTFLLYIRPIIGVIIGILADRSQTSLWLMISFILTSVGSILFASGLISDSTTMLFFLSTLIVAIGVYAARSLYFAVMEQGKIPLAVTGTAVGLISIVGYTPDIFAGPAMGYLLDSNPGIIGHRHVFWMLAGFALIGGIASGYFHYLYGRKKV